MNMFSSSSIHPQSSHTYSKDSALCQRFWISTALLGFSLALAYKVDIASSQAPIKSLQRKQVIPNLYGYSIHTLERCALQFMQYTRMTREKSRVPALNISCEINSKLLLHHPKLLLLIRKYQLCYALKKHQHFQAAISQGDILAALLSAVSLVILHA